MMDLGPSDADRQVLRFFATGNELGRAFMTAPGRAGRTALAALRKAMMDMLRDAEFVAEAKKRQIEIGPMPGGEVQTLIGETLQGSPALIAAAKKARDG